MRTQRQEACILGHTTHGSDNHCKTCDYTINNHHSTPEHGRPDAFGTLAKLGSFHTELLPGHTSIQFWEKLFPFRSDPKAMTVINTAMLAISNAASAQGYPRGLRNAYTTLLTGAAMRMPNW
jgi:hypothetical protein